MINEIAAGDPSRIDPELQSHYRLFRSLLKKNGSVLQLLADLEADLNFMDYTYGKIRRPIRKIVDETLLMAQELNQLDNDRHKVLYASLKNINDKLLTIFEQSASDHPREMAVRLSDGYCDAELIGGKAAGLGNLSEILPDHIPDGFILTTAAYRLYMEANGLNERIRTLIHDLSHIQDPGLFKSRLDAARQLFLSATLPEETREAIAEYAEKIQNGKELKWAVRSSSVQEDDLFTFAGQFDSLLGIETSGLESAYKEVLASRFSHRAMRYRLDHGFREIDTPMAVLIMPLIHPRFAGVIHTQAVGADKSDQMVVSTVPGLADAMVRGESPADTVFLSKEKNPNLIQRQNAVDPDGNKPLFTEHVSDETLIALGEIAQRLVSTFGYEMDIEWAQDANGKMWLLQGRRLHTAESMEKEKYSERASTPMLECGITVFPGRAEGPVQYIHDVKDLNGLKKGAIVVVGDATPGLAPILPHIGGLLVEHGNPVGHLATLVREFAVPCLFNMGEAVWKLDPGSVVSMDATKRRIYRGSQWHGLRDRVLARIQSRQKRKASGPLHDAVLALNLDDPHRSDFKPKNCKSLHDAIRYIHEMSVRSMFALGDQQNRFWKRRAIPLETPIQIKTKLIDLDGSALVIGQNLSPSKVFSRPFQALWRGLASAAVAWERRSNPTLASLPPDFVEQVMGGTKGPRRPSDTNYFIVANDYVNFNARFVFHYAMVDAVASPWMEKNYAIFRFQGGGASEANRNRRAKFLESVLRLSGFNVDCRGDLLAAWTRYHSQQETETALETLGKLMACARELDTILTNDDSVKTFTNYFMDGKLSAFL